MENNQDTGESSDIEDDMNVDTDDKGEGAEFNEKTLQKLKENDPDINGLALNGLLYTRLGDYEGGSFFKSIDWKKDGDCITNNTHIKRLWIWFTGRSYELPYTLGEDRHNLPTREQLQGFFSCIYQNRSINHLGTNSICIDDDFGGDLLEGLQGRPSLTKLDFESGNLGSNGCSAIGKVLKHPKCKLTELRLVDNTFDHEGFSALCDALAGNKTLNKLCLDYNKQISTPAGWRALSAVLQSANCNLVDLGLYNTGMNDEGVNLLGTALVSSSVSTLNLSNNKSISSEGWQTFMNQLSQTSIENLSLRDNNIDANGLAAFTSIGTLKSLDLSDTKIDDTALSSLANLCGNVKSLDLSHNQSITPSGWRSFFNSLQTRAIQLASLSISHNKVGGQGATALGGLLSNMSTLNALQMSRMAYSADSDSITSQGWVSFFTSLQNSNLNLVNLTLQNNNISDEGLQQLVRLASSMTSLKELNLGLNFTVNPTGWQALTGYLQSPSCALEDLYIDNNDVNDNTVVAFASALEHNKTLKWLGLHECCSFSDEEGNDSITERGWGAVSDLVCNKSSIMDTYNSNHKLFVDYSDDNELLPDDLSSLLELNENKDKTEVARQKILQTHFSGSGEDDTLNVQELLDMELEVLPTAIAWIGRPKHIGWEGKNVSGLSTMYNLVRKLPDLFDYNAQKKTNVAKRKREMSN